MSTVVTTSADVSRLSEAGRGPTIPRGMEEHLTKQEAFFDAYAGEAARWRRRNAGYHRAISSLARYYVPRGARVLEVGSGTGDLLAELQPSHGVGLDISRRMVEQARVRHPQLTFRHMPVELLDLPGEEFDYIILSDLVGHVYDIRMILERLRSVCHPRTRVVMHWYSRLWQPVLWLAERLGLKYPQPQLSWTTVEDVSNLLYLGGFEVVSRRPHILLPKSVPGLTWLMNRYVAHVPGFRWLCLTNWVVARPVGLEGLEGGPPSVSVICPCRNEEGNVASVVERLPALGRRTELIFVEGCSTDGTLKACRDAAGAHPERDIRVFVQEGRGKGDAVRLGFSMARGDVLVILDADLTVAPEDLPQFIGVLVSGKAEFVNGSRLVYPMDARSMRFLNLMGNKFFAVVLSSLLGQPVKDTLCGTKVLWRSDYERIREGRGYFGDLDPFGDFDLLFGAAKLNLKIVEVPVRYAERRYGETNISRFQNGWQLLRMSGWAASKLLFVT